MKKWIIVAFFILLLAGFSPPPQENDISLSVEAGFGSNGYYRAGEWTPLRVTVSSESENVNGFLRVRLPGGLDGVESGFQTPINFDRRSGDATLFLYTVLPSFAREVEVELVRDDGRIVSRGIDDVSQIAARDVMYGVITESLTGTIDTTRIPVGRGDNFQVNWALSEIPPDPNVLRSLDIMVFFDVDTGNLSVEQREALNAWIAGGGHLMVMGGANWQRTSAGLADLLPVQIEGTVPDVSIEALGPFLASTTGGLEEPTVISDIAPFEGSEVLLRSADNYPLIVRAEAGAGKVDYLAFDPQTAPLDEYDDLPRLWFELTTNQSPEPSWTDGFVDWSSAQRAVRVASNFDFPSVLQLLTFLGIYVLLIGPINYVLLRFLRRHELAWFTIPIFIVGFTVVAYFYGFSLRGNEPSVNHISVIQVWDDSELARVDTVFGIFSPRRTTFDVELEGMMSMRPLPQTDGDLLVDQTFSTQAIDITQGDTYRANDIPVDAGIVTSFTAEGYTPAPDYAGEVGWNLSSTGQTARLDGFIQTGITLDDAVLLVKDGSIYMGEINANDRREFDLTVALQEPSWLTFGNRTDTNQRFQFNGRQGRSMSYIVNNYYGVNCPQPGEFGTLIQIMQDDLLNCEPYEGFSDPELQSRLLILQSVLNDIDFSGGRGLDAYVVGWADSAPFSVDLTDQEEIITHQVLYIFRLSGHVNTTGQVAIAPGLMTWTVAGRTNPDTRRDISPYNITITSNEQAVMRFVPFEDLQHAAINGFEATMNIVGSQSIVKFALWNWETGEWDDVEPTIDDVDFLMKIQMTGEEARQYIGPNNALEVRINIEDDLDYANVTQLEVTMFGEL